MPGTIDHSRPCTSTYFTPFRKYTADAIIDYTLCESATNNELLLVNTSDDSTVVNLSVELPVLGGDPDFFEQDPITLKKGKIEKITDLFATRYKITGAIDNLQVASSEMFANGAQPQFIQQTFPKQPFVVDSSFEMKPSSEIFGISASDFPQA
jgi:hypothetical protein